MKWYYTDIRAEKTLKFCSWEARYLWREMLEYMHESEKPGYLLYSEEQLVELIHGATLERIRNCLFELETHKVFSRDRNGTIYSRKMVRDSKRAEVSRANGKRGGNPDLKKTQKKERKNGDNSEIELPASPEDKKENQNWDNQTLVYPDARCQMPESRIEDNKQQQHRIVARAAIELGMQIGAITGMDQSPTWFADAPRIERWLNAGWNPEKTIIPTIQRIMAKRTSPPNTLKFFEQAIADAHAESTKPLPKGNRNETHQPNNSRSKRADDATARALASLHQAAEHLPDEPDRLPSPASV